MPGKGALLAASKRMPQTLREQAGNDTGFKSRVAGDDLLHHICYEEKEPDIGHIRISIRHDGGANGYELQHENNVGQEKAYAEYHYPEVAGA